MEGSIGVGSGLRGVLPFRCWASLDFRLDLALDGVPDGVQLTNTARELAGGGVQWPFAQFLPQRDAPDRTGRCGGT